MRNETHPIRELIRRAVEGDDAAWDRVFAQYRRILLHEAHKQIPAMLRPKVGDSDACQETFMIAVRKLKGFRGTTEAEFKVWLLRILANVVKDKRRHFMDAQKRDVHRETSIEGLKSEVASLPPPMLRTRLGNSRRQPG